MYLTPRELVAEMPPKMLEGRQDCLHFLHFMTTTLSAHQPFWRHFRRQFARDLMRMRIYRYARRS